MTQSRLNWCIVLHVHVQGSNICTSTVCDIGNEHVIAIEQKFLSYNWFYVIEFEKIGGPKPPSLPFSYTHGACMAG